MLLSMPGLKIDFGLSILLNNITNFGQCFIIEPSWAFEKALRLFSTSGPGFIRLQAYVVWAHGLRPGPVPALKVPNTISTQYCASLGVDLSPDIR